MANPRTIGRIQSQIHRRVAHCLQFELADPRASFVTVTGVEVTNDLSIAKVRYSVLGDENEKSRTRRMLEDATGFVRSRVGRVLHTRTIPELRWEYDPSAEEAARLSQLIADARERDAAIRGDEEGADADEDTTAS